MAKKDDEFFKELLSTFRVEAEEHLKVMTAGLLELEKTPVAEKQMPVIENVFREAHSLKGAARAVNMTEIEGLCQSLESVFAALKEKTIPVSPTLLDMLHQAVDNIAKSLSSGAAQGLASEKAEIRKITRRLETVLKRPADGAHRLDSEQREAGAGNQEFAATDRPTAEPQPLNPGTVRISTAKLDSLLLKAEELLSAKLTAGQRAAELRELTRELAAWKKEWAKLRISDFGMRNEQSASRNPQFTEFFERGSVFVQSLENDLTHLAKSAEYDKKTLGAMVDNLLEDTKKVLMLPFASLLEILPKMVRDLSRDQGKEAQLVLEGGEIEIDKRILEEMRDPLIHLVRNSIDHGIEKPEERKRRKKSPHGTVTIAIAQKNGSNVEILISDDGAGIDLARIRSAILELGMVARADVDKMSEQGVVPFIFRSGVSTSAMITDISGRGLGLAIVREKVGKLGGLIFVETHPDVGTAIRIVLPLTLATFRGILVGARGQLFVIPTTNVERLVRVKTEGIKTVESRETIQLNGQTVSLVRLADVLEIPQRDKDVGAAEDVRAVVLGSAEKRIAFLVDEVLNEQEVLVKSLGKQLSRVRNIAGATVLGTGTVVPILNVPDLMKSAVRATGAAVKLTPSPLEREGARKKSVLVVEDSITARMLLRNILQAAGYDVKAAVDGVDGLTQLRSGEFDIVVSDVDMPRMNGFDLTAKIRADKKLAELPVILVTALETREDRERGIDVGANAYIVKSSFDQGNLLGAIQRLI